MKKNKYRGAHDISDSLRNKLDQITTIYVDKKENRNDEFKNRRPNSPNKRSKFEKPKEFPMRTAIRDSNLSGNSEDYNAEKKLSPKKRKNNFELHTAIRKSFSEDSSSEKYQKRKDKNHHKNGKSQKYMISDSPPYEKKKPQHKHKFAFSDSLDESPKPKKHKISKKEKFAISDSFDEQSKQKKHKISKKEQIVFSDSLDEQLKPNKIIKQKQFFISESPPPKAKQTKSTKKKKFIVVDPIQSLELHGRKLKKKLFDDSVQPINLKIISDPSHPKFSQELSEVDIRLWPNQFDKFFSIISSHLRKFKDNTDLCIEILNATESALNSEEAIDSLMKSGLLSFLPYSSKKLAIATCNLLKVPFQFKPEYFEENFEPMMNSLIQQVPCDMSLSLFQLYATSFEYIENPWPILDLLFKNKELYLSHNLSQNQIYDVRTYLATIFYLITNYDIFRKYRMNECRLIFVRVMSDHLFASKTVKFAFKVIIELFDCEFGRMIPISTLFNDLKEQTYEKYAIQLLRKMNISSIPIEEPYILQLVNTSHRYEDAFNILQKMLNNVEKNEEVASILLTKSKWIQFGLPSFSHTLLLFEDCIKFNSKHLIKIAKNIQEIPWLFQSILETEISSDIEAISDIMEILNFDTLEFLNASDFFNCLLDKLSDEGIENPKSYLNLVNYLILISYSPSFLELIPVLKKFLKNENHKIAHLTLKIFANMNQYKRCRSQMKNNKILRTAEKYCQSKSDQKYINILSSD